MNMTTLAENACLLLRGAVEYRRTGEPPDERAPSVLDAMDRLVETAAEQATQEFAWMRVHVRYALRHAAAHDAEAATILLAVEAMLRRTCGLPEAGATGNFKLRHPIDPKGDYDFSAPPPLYEVKRTAGLPGGPARWLGLRGDGTSTCVTSEYALTHARLWSEYMLAEVPRGYEIKEQADMALWDRGWRLEHDMKVVRYFKTEAGAREAAWSDLHLRFAWSLAGRLALNIWPLPDDVFGRFDRHQANVGSILTDWTLLERGLVAEWLTAIESGALPPAVRPACLDARAGPVRRRAEAVACEVCQRREDDISAEMEFFAQRNRDLEAARKAREAAASDQEMEASFDGYGDGKLGLTGLSGWPKG